MLTDQKPLCRRSWPRNAQKQRRFRPVLEQLEVRDLPSLSPLVSVTGFVTLSLDALGTNDPAGGTIRVQKPSALATVRAAYMAAASIPGGGQVVDGDVTLDGNVVHWDPAHTPVVNNIGGAAYNAWGNVTSLVKPKVDAAAAGIVNFTAAEGSRTEDIDGEILAVIFDDPAQTSSNTIVLLYGAQNSTGDSFSITTAAPIDKTNPNLVLDMSLGITFGYQTPDFHGQFSQVDVNGTRMTSSAGGQDDGHTNPDTNPEDYPSVGDGALITVGGIGDTDANPADPFSNGDSTSPRYDDELYSLLPFVNTGDTTITVHTLNPSNDDNILFAAFNLKGATAVVGEGIVLGPATQTDPVHSNATVTATVVDKQGRPLVGQSVHFVVISGPNAGLTGDNTTDTNGHASFTYSSSLTGTDVLDAQFVDSSEQTEVSNTVTVNWTGQAAHGLIVTGQDAGGSTEVKAFDDETGVLKFDFYAFGSNPAGVRVATADVNGDGFPDIITTLGAGGLPEVKVFDGQTGLPIYDFYAFGPSVTQGLYVAGGDVSADGFADIIVGTGAGRAGEVKVFSGKDASPLYDFFAYNSLQGVRVGAGDVTGDGFADIITGTGPGGPAEVKVFSGATGLPFQDYFAFPGFVTNGIFVAGGDTNGDGRADVIVGLDAGGMPEVKVFDGQTGAALLDFLAYDGNFHGGVRVGATGLNNEGISEIITGPGSAFALYFPKINNGGLASAPTGSTTGPLVRLFDGLTGAEVDQFFAYDPSFNNGIFVGGTGSPVAPLPF